MDEHSVPKLLDGERVVAARGCGYFPVLIQLEDNRLAAVIRGGAPHVGIEGRLEWITSDDGGRTWSRPRIVVDSDCDDRNPALGQMEDGSIVLSYAECRNYDKDGKYTRSGGFEWFFVLSNDGGETWSEKEPLFRGPIGKDSSPYGKIRVLADGTATMPVYGDKNPEYHGEDELPVGGSQDFAGVIRSLDFGNTWGDFSLVASGFNETAIVELPDGVLLTALRPHSATSRSRDGGRTWSRPSRVTQDMQHPADLCLLNSGKVLMVYGNRVEPFGVGCCLSSDGGKTWDYEHRVMLGWDSENRDCGYPSVVQLEDGTIVVIYYSVGTAAEPGVEQAICVRFTEEQLLIRRGGRLNQPWLSF